MVRAALIVFCTEKKYGWIQPLQFEVLSSLPRRTAPCRRVKAGRQCQPRLNNLNGLVPFVLEKTECHGTGIKAMADRGLLGSIHGIQFFHAEGTDLALIRESKDFVENKSAGVDGANKILGGIGLEAVVNMVTV
jgi:hypothetical protein